MAEHETETRQGVSQASVIKVVMPGDGTYRAELPDGEFVTNSIEELVDVIRLVLQSIKVGNANGGAIEAEEEDDDIGFEADLDYVLTKNAELYRRLAQ